MKKIFYSIAVLVFAAAIFASCRKETAPDILLTDSGQELRIDVLEPEVYNVDASGRVTRSPFPYSSDVRSSVLASNDVYINELTVWTYENGQLANSCHFSGTDLSSGLNMAQVLGPGWARGTFDVLLLGNMGDRSDEAPEAYQDALLWKYDVSLYRNFTHFPLYGRSEGVTMNTSSLTVRRVVSEYRFSFRKAPGNPNRYRMEEFHIHNVSRYIRPFTSGYRAEEKTDTFAHGNEAKTAADYFSRAQIDAVNEALDRDGVSGPVSVFAFENMQGDFDRVLFGSRERKTVENVKKLKLGKEDVCTYFEAVFDVEEIDGDSATHYENTCYRWFMGYGENMETFNFDVPGNVIFNVEVDFSSMAVRGDGWRISPEYDLKLVPKVDDILVLGGMTKLVADVYKSGSLYIENQPCTWELKDGGVAVLSTLVPDVAVGRSAGRSGFVCRTEVEGVPISSSGEFEVEDFRLNCYRESKEGDDEEDFYGIDNVEFTCSGNYALFEVRVSICDVSDLDDCYEIFSASTISPEAKQKGWKNANPNMVQNFVRGELDEEELEDARSLFSRSCYIVSATFKSKSGNSELRECNYVCSGYFPDSGISDIISD